MRLQESNFFPFQSRSEGDAIPSRKGEWKTQLSISEAVKKKFFKITGLFLAKRLNMS